MTSHLQNTTLFVGNQSAVTRRTMLPVDPDGSIVVSFGYRILLFGHHAPHGWFAVRHDQEILSKAKVVNFVDEYKRVAVLSDNPMASFLEFASQMVWVEAAGGVVECADGDIVLIRRGERWDLPKGHREEGEDFAACAAREAEEETGVKVHSVGELLATTLHAYNMYGKWELKLTTWYHMCAQEKTALVPQREEGIIGAEWVAPADVKRRVKDSFPTIKKVFSSFFK